MKVQTNSKSEPKFPKRDDSNLFYFLSQKRFKSGSNQLKIGTREQRKNNSNKIQNRVVKREGSTLNFQILSLPF